MLSGISSCWCVWHPHNDQLISLLLSPRPLSSLNSTVKTHNWQERVRCDWSPGQVWHQTGDQMTGHCQTNYITRAGRREAGGRVSCYVEKTIKSFKWHFMLMISSIERTISPSLTTTWLQCRRFFGSDEFSILLGDEGLVPTVTSGTQVQNWKWLQQAPLNADQ